MVSTVEYDPERGLENAQNGASSIGWGPSDVWKVHRKGAKIRQINPAAKLANKAGVTTEFDKKNQIIRFWYKKRIIGQIDKETWLASQQTEEVTK
jgi:hypothetical protein